MPAHRPDIVVLDEGRLLDGGLDWQALHTLGRLTIHSHTPLPDILPRAAGKQIILTNKTPLDAATLAALPDLRFISVLATGFNIVDTAAARARNIPVSNVPSYSTASVAQHTFALILELANRVGQHAAAVSRGHWSQSGSWSAPLAPMTELHGLRLGLIGRGRIARRVAEIAAAFGLETSMASISHPEGGDGLVPLDKIAAVSDIVSLHCQLTEASHGIINAGFLARMKPSAFLINTARGALINEHDLAAALASGTIAGSALDVLSSEPPPPDHPLLRAPNCLITPHIAWMGLPSRKRLVETTADNIKAFLAGAPIHVVNPQ